MNHIKLGASCKVNLLQVDQRIQIFNFHNLIIVQLQFYQARQMVQILNLFQQIPSEEQLLQFDHWLQILDLADTCMIQIQTLCLRIDGDDIFHFSNCWPVAWFTVHDQLKLRLCIFAIILLIGTIGFLRLDFGDGFI